MFTFIARITVIIILSATPADSLSNSPMELNDQLISAIPNEYIAYIVHMDDGTHFLRYKGNISAYAVQLMMWVQVMYPNITHLEIMSGGGEFLQGLTLGIIIKQMNLPVVVPKEQICLSACSFAVMGSPSITLDGWLGFHTPYVPNELKSQVAFDSGMLTSTQAAYYFHNMNWKFDFWMDILMHTSKDTYMIYSHADDLLPMKIQEDETVTSSYISSSYNIMTSAEISKMVSNGDAP
jgi:hypothetical protein